MTTITPELREKFAAVVRHGGFHCLACDALCEVEHHGDQSQRCADCGSSRIRYLPPVLDSSADNFFIPLTPRSSFDINK